MVTITPSTRHKTYNPVTPTSAFPVSFPIFDNSDVKLYCDDVEILGFTITGTYFDGVCENATIHVNPGIFGKIDIVGLRTPQRTDQYVNGRPLNIKDHNYSLNRLTIESQEARRDIGNVSGGLKKEQAERIAADNELHKRLDQEAIERASGDAALQYAIQDERAERIASDEAIRQQVDGIIPTVAQLTNRAEAAAESSELSSQTAQDLVEAAVSGSIGFQPGIAYDFGWTSDQTTYFDRDFGAIA